MIYLFNYRAAHKTVLNKTACYRVSTLTAADT